MSPEVPINEIQKLKLQKFFIQITETQIIVIQLSEKQIYKKI